MQDTEIEYLNGEFTVAESEPSTLAELTALLGNEADVIAEAANNLRYRNKYPRVYRAVSAALEAEGVKRGVVDTKTLKDGTTRDVLESVNDHLRAFLKDGYTDEHAGIAFTAEDAKDKLTALFSSIAPAEPLYVKGERTTSAGKVSGDALASAKEYFAQGTARVSAIAAKIEELIGGGYKIGKTADGEPTEESLARGLMVLNKFVAKQAAEQAKAQLSL